MKLPNPEIQQSWSHRGRLSVIRRWPSNGARRWTTGFVDEMATRPNIWAVVAYGSSVRDVEISSDIDLLVVCDATDYEIPTPPIDVDVRILFLKDIDNHIRKENDILLWALKFGEVIYERELYWTRLKRECQDKLPLPSAEAA